MDPELKKLLDGIEDAATRKAMEAAFTKMADNNKKLTDEVKAEREKKREAEAKAEAAAKEKSELADKELEAEKDAEKVREAMQKKVDAAEKKAAAAEAKVDTANGRYTKLASEQSINEALEAAGVKPELKTAARALLTTQNEVKIGDDGSVSIGDKAVKDFVSAWAETEEGGGFVVPGNKGGGSKNTPGGTPGGGTPGKETKPDLGGDHASRVAAIQEKFGDKLAEADSS